MILSAPLSILFYFPGRPHVDVAGFCFRFLPVKRETFPGQSHLCVSWLQVLGSVKRHLETTMIDNVAVLVIQFK